jgi:predicted O-methyltransferase YrrM
MVMGNDDKSIHEFDVALICEYFSSLERQGPGSPEVTIKALSFIDNLNDKSLIADIGCGSGGQTMVLARHAPGNITGIDLFPIFIDMFNRNVEKLNLQDRVKGIVESMDNLPFRDKELDLMWSDVYFGQSPPLVSEQTTPLFTSQYSNLIIFSLAA